MHLEELDLNLKYKGECPAFQVWKKCHFNFTIIQLNWDMDTRLHLFVLTASVIHSHMPGDTLTDKFIQE